jgi:hypothetical protein
MRQHLEVDASLVESGPANAAPSLKRRPPVLLGVVETPPAGLRARQLFEDAQAASLEHLRGLESAIATVRDLSDEIVRGGELYMPGLRELARKLSEDLFWKGKTLALLSLRQSDRPRGSP